MTAKFCLSATLHTGNAKGKKLLGELLAAGPKRFRACYVGCFHDDDPDWAKVTIDFLEKNFRAEVSAPRLSDPGLDVKQAREAIESADFLYLDGGDTVEGVRHARERGLVSAFRRAAKNAFLVFGLSGGACAAPPYTIGYDDEGEGYVADCFDMGPPAPLDVHDEANDWPEMRALLELKKDGEGIVVPTGSALIVDPEGKLATWGKAPCERRRLGARGAWKVEKIPVLE